MKHEVDKFVDEFGWSKFVILIDGWIPRFALFVPIIGYLILFNDQMSSLFDFTTLTGASTEQSGFSATGRLRMLYFGLILLGSGNLLYRLLRPSIFKYGTNRQEYVSVGLELFTLKEFSRIHGDIDKNKPTTIFGEYSDEEWKAFHKSLLNGVGGASPSWENSKATYGDLLRSMLIESFCTSDRQNIFGLKIVLALSSFGYVLLALPSIDIFRKVLLSTLGV